MTIQLKQALRLALIAAWAVAGPVGAADGDTALNAYVEQFRNRVDTKEWLNAMMPSGTGTAYAGASQSADEAMSTMLRQYSRVALDRGHWTNDHMGDASGYAAGNSLLAVAPGSGVSGITREGIHLAGLAVQPLRSFNAYLAYLGQRMRVDAGPPGPLLQNDRGTDAFDRYIEEINFRIQTLYRAEDSAGQ